MSGHSKWHTIKHKKGAADAKRGKVFTRIIKELTVAARDGGGDPDRTRACARSSPRRSRSTCRPTTSSARSSAAPASCPASTTKRSPTRATAPAARRVIIETLTDNKNRTVGEMRHMLGKYGGNLAAENSVAWMFEKKGYIVVEKAKADEDTLMAAAIDAGADDMRDDGEAGRSCRRPMRSRRCSTR